MTTVSSLSSLATSFSKAASDTLRKADRGFASLLTGADPTKLSGLPFQKSEEPSKLPFEPPPIADGLPFEPPPIIDSLPFEPPGPSDDLIATQRLAYLLWSGKIGVSNPGLDQNV